MSEQPADIDAPAADTASDAAVGEASDSAEHWRKQAREWERRANGDRSRAEKAEAQLQQSRLAPQEQLQAARADGERVAVARLTDRLVRSELRHALGDRPGADVLLDAVDINRFLDDSGDVDLARVKAWAGSAGQDTGGGAFDIGLGRRTVAPPAPDMNTLIRRSVTGERY